MEEKKDRGLLDKISIDEIKQFLTEHNEDKMSTNTEVFEVLEENDNVNVDLYIQTLKGNKIKVSSATVRSNYAFDISVGQAVNTDIRYGQNADLNKDFFKFMINKLGDDFINNHMSCYRQSLENQIMEMYGTEETAKNKLNNVREKSFREQMLEIDQKLRFDIETAINKLCTKRQIVIDGICKEMSNEQGLQV